MSRYVDVEPLDVVGTKGVSKDYAEGMAYVLDLLDNLPIADVEPVRHGRWIKHYECCDAFVCSECGTPSIVTQNYCCNCGAKMDEKERENEQTHKEKA